MELRPPRARFTRAAVSATRALKPRPQPESSVTVESPASAMRTARGSVRNDHSFPGTTPADVTVSTRQWYVVSAESGPVS